MEKMNDSPSKSFGRLHAHGKVCVAVFLLCLVLAGLLIKSAVSKAAIVDMPDLKKMERAEAMETLEKLGLVFDEDNSQEMYHDEIPAGCVIFQSIGAGENVKKGSTVSLVFSKGPEKAAFLEVPTFVGMTKQEVEDRLKEIKKTTGYTFVVSEYHKEYSAAVPAGRVVAQSLQPGEMEKSDSKLYLSLSLGPKKITMPKLTGMQEKDAVNTLEKLNLTARINYQYSAGSASGIVLSQSISEKEEIAEGTEVVLTVSQGASPASGTNKSSSDHSGYSEQQNATTSSRTPSSSTGGGTTPPQNSGQTPQLPGSEDPNGDWDSGDSDSSWDSGDSDSDWVPDSGDSDSSWDSGDLDIHWDSGDSDAASESET